MTGWIMVALGTLAFTLVMGGLLRSALGPWFDAQADERLSAVDEDLDVMYGGWRNLK